MSVHKLFTPLKVGAISISNRVVMAPLTRLRNIEPGDIPGPLAIEYYKQRASSGLIVNEGTHISQTAKGYAGAPGIYSDDQILSWKKVTSAVHEAGGKIALQLWHCGRISHSSLQPNNQAPVGPSAIAAESNTNIRDKDGKLGRAKCDVPRALEISDIKEILNDFRKATINSREAGFDLVEIHGAHGYLLDQFLSPSANNRTDEYGGSIENRARFHLEVVDSVVEAWDADHVGIRISPLGIFNGVTNTDQEEAALFLASELAKRKLAYLHISEPDWAGGPALSEEFRIKLRERYSGVIIGAGAYTKEKAQLLIDKGLIDAAAFGRSYISNPDLVERMKADAPLNKPNSRTFYGGGAEGYTDYPTLSSS